MVIFSEGAFSLALSMSVLVLGKTDVLPAVGPLSNVKSIGSAFPVSE